MVPLFPVMIVRRDWVRVLPGGMCWVVGVVILWLIVQYIFQISDI